MGGLSKQSGEMIGAVIFYVVGTVICLLMLFGAFAIGKFIAPMLGWTGDLNVAGLITVFAFVWLYEHKFVSDEFEKIQAQINNLHSSMKGH